MGEDRRETIVGGVVFQILAVLFIAVGLGSDTFGLLLAGIVLATIGFWILLAGVIAVGVVMGNRDLVAALRRQGAPLPSAETVSEDTRSGLPRRRRTRR